VNPTDHIAGDLARMSYHTGIVFPRHTKVELPKRHIHFNKYKKQRIDMVTIGDSFSNGGGGGLNNYYQDYIATYSNLSVLNLPSLKGAKNYIEVIALLNNSGWLTKKGVKYVLLSSVQRLSVDRFSGDINFKLKASYNIDNSIINSYDIYNPKSKDKQKITFINNLNANAIKYNVKFMFKGYGKYKSYCIDRLSKDFFTSNIKNEIIFYKDDIAVIQRETKKKLFKLNSNLNRLANKLSKNGIKLFYMPAVDKYNLYSPYITSNTYAKSSYFEILRELPKKYIFIDTKKILSKELENGEKDIFFSDDTHWSHKASEAIFKSVKIE
jgi:hypothetical protein